MPLVFVHGVANRMGDSFRAGERTRNAFFRQFLLREHDRDHGEDIPVYTPYWGDLAAKLHWHGASLPLGDFENLGADDAELARLHASAYAVGTLESEDRAVLEVARRSLPDAVDLLWASAALAADDEADALAALAGRARAYAVANPRPAWLDEVDTDQELITRFAEELETFTVTGGVHAGAAGDAADAAEEFERLGPEKVWQALRRGVGRLKIAVTGAVGKEASERLRPAVAPRIADFLGDVFVYLHQQDDVAGPIRDTVAAALREAAGDATPEDPLVVVVHSMGGNIVYDLLLRELRDLRINLLVSAGTQVGFFEELKLFRDSDPKVPGEDLSRKVPRPPGVRRWVNIFDHADLLGFRVGSIIEGVEDYAYTTGSLFTAHSQYFVQPSFHERLMAKVTGADDG